MTGLAISAILTAGLGPSVRARAQVLSKRKELTHIQKELESTRRQIEEYRRLEESLGQELQRIEGRNAEARRRMSDLRRGMRSAEGRKRELKSRLEVLGQASGYWRSAMISDVRGYNAGLASRNDALGRMDLWREALQRAAIVEKAGLVSGLQGLGRRTAQAEAEVRRKAQELQQKTQRVQAEQHSRAQEYQQKKAAIADAQEKVVAATAHAKELEESARALTRLISALGKVKRGKPSRGGAARLDVPRNSLPWPAEGKVVSAFGRQRNPELNTWVIHQGIVVGTAAGAPVAAVGRGHVIFAGPFRSYGQVVILDHGSNFFSIYGELGEIRKAKGSADGRVEVIATAGADKQGQGGSVYLEIRRGTEALDPLAWLKRR